MDCTAAHGLNKNQRAPGSLWHLALERRARRRLGLGRHRRSRPQPRTTMNQAEYARWVARGVDEKTAPAPMPAPPAAAAQRRTSIPAGPMKMPKPGPGQAFCLLLVTSSEYNQAQFGNSERARVLLAGQSCACEEIDGALPEHKARRDELFALSGTRGGYPQVFLQKADGAVEFVGLWEKLEELNECGSLPADVLAANPQVPTFQRVFADCLVAR